MLPAFTCAVAIGNLWSIYLRINVLSPFPYFLLYLALDTFLEQSSNNSIAFCRLSVKCLNIPCFNWMIFCFFTSYYYLIYIWFGFLWLFLCFLWCFYTSNLLLYFYQNLVDLKYLSHLLEHFYPYDNKLNYQINFFSSILHFLHSFISKFFKLLFLFWIC